MSLQLIGQSLATKVIPGLVYSTELGQTAPTAEDERRESLRNFLIEVEYAQSIELQKRNISKYIKEQIQPRKLNPHRGFVVFQGEQGGEDMAIKLIAPETRKLLTKKILEKLAKEPQHLSKLLDLIPTDFPVGRLGFVRNTMGQLAKVSKAVTSNGQGVWRLEPGTDITELLIDFEKNRNIMWKRAPGHTPDPGRKRGPRKPSGDGQAAGQGDEQPGTGAGRTVFQLADFSPQLRELFTQALAVLADGINVNVAVTFEVKATRYQMPGA